MVSSQNIREAVRLIVKAMQVILFGSYSRGNTDSDSDVDLLVVLPQVENRFKEMVQLRRLLRPLRIPVDVPVFSRAEVEDWGHLPGTVLYLAMKEGKILHEKTN